MFQPRVKLEFVKRYCHPKDAWKVFVDIDPSEMGRTGGEPKTPAASERRKKMQEDGHAVKKEFERVGVAVGKFKEQWKNAFGDKAIPGDRDIVAVNEQKRTFYIVEVEGELSAQPEQKVYHAVGQIVKAVSECEIKGYSSHFIVAVYGEKMAGHLAKALALEELGVSGICLGETQDQDNWLFGGMAAMAESIGDILKFLPVFEQEGYHFGECESVAGEIFSEYSYSSEVDTFIRALYDQSFIYRFDWGSWQDEAERYCREPERLETVGLTTVRKLLTTHVRKERFCDGHLYNALKGGHITGILRRLKEIHDNQGRKGNRH